MSLPPPPTQPSVTPPVRNPDADHLRVLAICHFVGVGLAIVGLGFLGLHYLVLHSVFTDPALWANQKDGPPPAALFAMFKWFYVAGAVFMVTSGVLNLVSGLCLRARKHRTFSLVVAAFDCMHLPLGTVLGVFTFVVLLRDSVRTLYAETERR